MRRWSFTKGHGTENDFVILLDREGMLGLGPSEVRYLCDRHAGLGADGVLRAVLAGHVPEWTGPPEVWFMDYRNADGSVAEMCGNGIRVFAKYLLEEGLADGPEVEIATRAGAKRVLLTDRAEYRVAMGPAGLTGVTVTVRTADGGVHQAIGLDVGNPHAVSFVADPDTVWLHAAPVWSPPETFPEGVNLEFVAVRDDRAVSMRVYERGSGETRSCGTGTVAAAVAAWSRQGSPTRPQTYEVFVPGGRVEVELGDEGAYLTGPATIVAHGEVVLPERSRRPTLED